MSDRDGVRQEVRRILCKFATLLAVMLVVLVSLEIGARVWVVIADSPIKDYYAFMKSQPLPYAEAEYFSDAFVEDYIRSPGEYQARDTGLILPIDYTSRYLNIRNGERVTAFQPSSAVGTVYVLGGSTVVGREVPDEHTIPSRLQLRWRDRRVENLGVATVTVAQQLKRLKLLPLTSDDIVIFYDGVNEIYQGVYFDDVDGTTPREIAEQVAAMPFQRRLTISLYERLYHRSRFVTYFLDPFDATTVPEHLTDDERLHRIVSEVGRNYVETIAEAHAYCASHGASFYHFLQPQLFSNEAPSEYETRVMRTTHLVPAGVERSFHAGYPLLRRAVRELVERGVSSTDLSLVLNGRSAGHEYYLDFCHVTHVANDLLAEEIARVVGRPSTERAPSMSTSADSGLLPPYSSPHALREVIS